MDNISLPGIEGLSYRLLRSPVNIHAGPGSIDFVLGNILSWARAGKKVVIELENESQLKYWQQRLMQLPELQKDEVEWTRLPTHLQEHLLLLEQRQNLARQSRLGTYTTAELLGRQRYFIQQQRAALAGFSINTEGLEFTEEEYFLLLDQIQNTRKLARKIGRVDPALRELNSGIFRHQSETESEGFIRSKVNDFQQQAAALYRAYSLSLDRFSRQQFEQSDATYRQLVKEIEPLEHQLVIGIVKNENDRAKAAWIPLWNSWKKQLEKQDLFEFSLPERPEKTTREELLRVLKKFRSQLDVWYAGQVRRTREASVGLSPGSLTSGHPLRIELEQLAERLEQLVGEINEAGLYHLPLSADAATSLRQQKLLEQLQEQLQRTAYLLENYSPNFRWQQNWFQLLPAARRIVSPLLQFPDEDWTSLFSSWYLDQCLQGSQQLISPVIPSTHRLRLAEELDKWRFRLLPLKAVELVVREAGDQPPPADCNVRFSLLKDSDSLDQESSEKVWHVCRIASEAGINYHAQSGPVRVPSLGFLQAAFSRDFPDWRRKEAWPNVGKQAYSLGVAPVDFRGDWPPPLPDFWEAPKGRLQLFIGRLAANSPGLGELTQLLCLPVSLDIVHSLADREVTQMLLQDGFQLSFLVAAIIRSTECIEDQDFQGWQAMLSESRLRLGIRDPRPHPLLEALAVALPTHSFQLNEAWRDTYLPMVIQSASSGKKTVVLPDGLLPGVAGAAEECLRQADLIAAGFSIFDLPTYYPREDWEGVVKELVGLSK